MNRINSKRVAPLIALLVIIFGSIAFFLIPSLKFPDISFPDNSRPTNSPAIVVQATATPSTPQDEYQFHRSRDELQVALFHIETHAALNGWTAQTHIQAGNLWRDMGDLGRALPHWESAIVTEPNANLLRQIASIYLERGEWSIAWERIQALLELAPNDSWAIYYAGLILAPSDPSSAYGYLGQVAILENTYSETAQNILNEIGDTENDADIILRVAAGMAGANEWSLAENAYQYAADLYYPFPEATAYTGLMRILQGKNGEAWINEALALAPDNPDVNYVAGVYWREAGEYLLSEEALIDAIALEPTNPIFFTELGITYHEMGNRLDAEIWLQTAVIVSGNNPVMVEALENFYEDYYLASQALIGNEPVPSNVQDPSVISANGWALHVQGDTDGGLALIEEALALDPTNPRALFDRARIYLETDRRDLAIPLLEILADGDSVFAGPAQGLLQQQN